MYDNYCDNHMLMLTSHPEVQLLHDDVVLEVRIPSKVEADPVAQFVILKSLDLKETKMICLSEKDGVKNVFYRTLYQHKRFLPQGQSYN